jgi:hypothetical protein
MQGCGLCDGLWGWWSAVTHQQQLTANVRVCSHSDLHWGSQCVYVGGVCVCVWGVCVQAVTHQQQPLRGFNGCTHVKAVDHQLRVCLVQHNLQHSTQHSTHPGTQRSTARQRATRHSTHHSTAHSTQHSRPHSGAVQGLHADLEETAASTPGSVAMTLQQYPKLTHQTSSRHIDLLTIPFVSTIE